MSTNTKFAQSIEQDGVYLDANLGAKIKHSAIKNKFLARNFTFQTKNYNF